MRPSPELYAVRTHSPDDRIPGGGGSGGKRRTTSRWLTVYLPVLLIVGILLYIACEVIMKVLAMRTVHSLARDLPEHPQPLKLTQTPAFQTPMMPAVIPPPPMMPPKPPRAMSINSLRSFVLPATAVCG